MDQLWKTYDAWVAHFDLLGFRAKLRTLPISILQLKANEIVRSLQEETGEFEDIVDSLYYADTFIFYSKSGENQCYPGLMHVATHFMQKSISKGIALRGAIAYGEIAVNSAKNIMLGRAFLDSHQYCEDQDWLGLILTPTASDQLKEAELIPERHGFVYSEIPKRDCHKSDQEAYAYTFCRGATNFPCPLLGALRGMQTRSPKSARDKYERTIQFLDKHWKMIEPPNYAGDSRGSTRLENEF